MGQFSRKIYTINKINMYLNLFIYVLSLEIIKETYL